MTNWQREIAKFAPELSVGVYHGSNRVLPEAVKDLPDVTLTTYGLMRRETEKLAGYKWRLLVLDEAQAVKKRRLRSIRGCKIHQGHANNRHDRHAR